MRSGVCEQTGKWLTGWSHCVQSIGVILRTRISSRPWARHFGAAVKDLQDDNATSRVLIEFARDTATALAAFEPGFRLTEFNVERAGRDGRFQFVLVGDFFPRGHLGDFSIKQNTSLTIAGSNDNLSGLQAIELGEAA